MSLRHPALLPALASTLFGSAAAGQETRESATVTVTGTVVSELTGQPIAGAVVVMEAPGLTFVTDEQGQFVVDPVPRGVYGLKVIHKDYLRLDGDLAIDRPGEFFLGLTPIADSSEGMITGIVGLVTDQASGQPVSEVVVNVKGLGRTATTNEEGRFTVSELIPGRHDVVFSPSGIPAALGVD